VTVHLRGVLRRPKKIIEKNDVQTSVVDNSREEQSKMMWKRHVQFDSQTAAKTSLFS